MKEFKGTKGRLTVKEAIGPRNELLFFCVQHKGNSIADFSPNPYTEIPTSLESAKANALIFSKAPEMLVLLNQSLRQLQSYGDLEPTFLTRKIEKLIKEATEV